MNEDLALFRREDAQTLVDMLRSAGYTVAHPKTGHIRGWSSDGDLVLLPGESQGIEFLLNGAGLQLWRNESNDLFVSVVEERPCVSFDGVDESEVFALIRSWEAAGLKFELLLEDDLQDALDAE